MLPIQEYIDYALGLWKRSSCDFPMFSKEYSEAEKLLREDDYEKFQLKVKALQRADIAKKMKRDRGEAFFVPFKTFMQSVFDFEEEQLAIILSDEFKMVTKDFVSKARRFAPEMGMEGIYQALRNVWVMNGLQYMVGKPVKITPSVFAYSMMYPYSDNLLDDSTIPRAEKLDFSKRFNQRLYGEQLSAQNQTEKQLFQLVDMVESEFSRTDFQDVYDSLYAIQQGQTNSMQLLGSDSMLKDEIQQICFEKGGASVLTDGFLVAGELSQKQQQAVFCYGVYLQLLDDIQDVKQDWDASAKTMFSILSKEERSLFVNKTFHFGRKVMTELLCFNQRDNQPFCTLMLQSIEKMLLESIGQNYDCFDKDYVENAEQYFPMHYAFSRQKHNENRSRRFEVFQKYFSKL